MVILPIWYIRSWRLDDLYHLYVQNLKQMIFWIRYIINCWQWNKREKSEKASTRISYPGKYNNTQNCSHGKQQAINIVDHIRNLPWASGTSPNGAHHIRSIRLAIQVMPYMDLTNYVQWSRFEFFVWYKNHLVWEMIKPKLHEKSNRRIGFNIRIIFIHWETKSRWKYY